MDKRGKKAISLFEIILLVSVSFAIAFILNENFVSAQYAGTFAESGGPTAGIDAGASAAPAAVNPLSNHLTLLKESGGGSVTNTPSNSIRELLYGKDDLGSLSSGGPKTPPPEGGFKPFETVKDLFGGKLFGTPETTASGSFTTEGGFAAWGNSLFGAVAWAGVAYLAGQLLGSLFGWDKGQTNALSYGLASGVGTFAFIEFAVKNGIFSSEGFFGYSSFLNFGMGALVGIGVFILTYSKEKRYSISIECLPYEPPIGGAKCEECNGDPFRPCSEYRCKALGQACQIVNPGTEEERCVWVNPKDVNSPIIESWFESLKPKGLKYVPDNAIRPPNRGVKIVSGAANGCIAAFTPLEFGIKLNEPASCRLDYNMTYTFDEMAFSFGGSNFLRYNHTQKMKLPGPPETDSEASPILQNNGVYSLYSRCRDANGNENVDAFVFTFCVDPSPDTTPPNIEGFSINDNGFVRFNTDTFPIEVYTNEPADCKWSRQDKDYEDMENTMTCFTEEYQINADLNYVCFGNLSSIVNRQDNIFYFRCLDQPNKEDKDRNVMTQSRELTLKGTQELNIIEVLPNGTIYGSTDRVEIDLYVKTDDGAEEGKAQCYLSSTGEKDSYIRMEKTESYEHSQKLFLPQSTYQYYFRCVDLGGNSDNATTSFTIFVDKQAPVVTRAYKEDALKIVTDEDAECTYSLSSCNFVFEEGLKMIYSDYSNKQNHYAEWEDNKIYYIKCKDFYGNEPSPNECNIVARSIELSSN